MRQCGKYELEKCIESTRENCKSYSDKHDGQSRQTRKSSPKSISFVMKDFAFFKLGN